MRVRERRIGFWIRIRINLVFLILTRLSTPFLSSTSTTPTVSGYQHPRLTTSSLGLSEGVSGVFLLILAYDTPRIGIGWLLCFQTSDLSAVCMLYLII